MSLTSFPDRGLRTVVRLRGTAGTGGYGDPTIDWSNPDRKIIRSCDWQPEQGQEISLDRDAVVTRWRWFGPINADVTDQDRLEVDGLVYYIEGSVEEWPGEWLAHKTALCRRSTG